MTVDWDRHQLQSVPGYYTPDKTLARSFLLLKPHRFKCVYESPAFAKACPGWLRAAF